MNLIIYMTNLYNNKEFIDMVLKLKDIMGIMLDVIMTKDNRILVFSRGANNTVQDSSLEEIAYDDVLTLDDALNMLREFKGKIIINMLPLQEDVLAKEFQKVIEANLSYANSIYDIFRKYQGLNLYVSSTSYNLLYQVNKVLINYKRGVFLSLDNSSYIDVDFYIFSSWMLNEKIMLEQLQINKEVMVMMEDIDDMNEVIRYFKNKKSGELFQYITAYPLVFLE